VDNPASGSVMSASNQVYGADVTIGGSATVSGDIYATGEDGTIEISGSPTIAGSSDSTVYASHLHEHAPMPDFPELDLDPLTVLAVNVYDGDGSTTETLSNIRIPPNTNPTFSKDIAINGIVYIQLPNDVHFTGKVTLNGMIVTDDPGESGGGNILKFSGQVVANGVEDAPNDPMFDEIKQHTGTFILAPGCDVSFVGKVAADNGSIAADMVSFAGTAEGHVWGTIIGLKEGVSSNILGTVDISINKATSDPNAPLAGFVMSLAFDVDRDSYQEVAE